MTLSTFVTKPLLIPVVELEPSRFGDLDLPPLPWSDRVAHDYWKSCLAQSGLDHLNPIAMRSWLVCLADLRDETTLGVILRSLLDRYAEQDGEISPLMGGFALFNDTDPIFLPQCCGDFCNLESWQAAANYRGSDPITIWIGHPWLQTRYNAPNLVIWPTSDTGEAANNEEVVIVEPDMLASAVASTHTSLIQFSTQVLAPQLRRMGRHDSNSVSDTLLGLSTRP